MPFGDRVPLQARGHMLGTLTLISDEAERIYDETDLRVAEDFASRASLAIDNARLYAEARSAVRARDEMIAVVSHDSARPAAVDFRRHRHPPARPADGRGR